MATRRTLVLLLGLALLGMRATPVHAQEEVTLQISGTDPQFRAINTWIDQTSQGTNHSTDLDLHVGTGGSGAIGQNNHAILQFDISRIPRSGIKLATLNLWLDAAPGSVGETWDVNQMVAPGFITWSQAGNITWTHRTNQLTWGAAGGDFTPGASACQITPGTTSGVPLSCDVTSTVMTYFGGVPPNPNYGFLIQDTNEDTAAAAAFGQIASNATTGTHPSGCGPSPAPPCVSNAPSLVVDFIQQVHSLTATPSATNVVLTWKYPTAVGTTTGLGLNGFGLNPTSGVVILRSEGSPVDDLASFQDGTAPPALCNFVNGSTTTILVFNGSTGLPPTFTDDNTDSCGFSPTTTYFYKVIAVAQIGATANFNYSEEGNATIFGLNGTEDTSFVAEISATPGATPQAPVWIAPVRSAALNAPSIDPGNYAIVATDNFLVQGFNPTTGDDAFAPISVGGIVGGFPGSRMPVLESTEADPLSGFGAHPMTYLTADDNLVYDVELDSSGFLLDLLNPLFGAGISGTYMGGVAMQAKAFSNLGNTKPDDVLVAGTNEVGMQNTIFAAVTCSLSVAPGTGCSGSGGGWNISGGSVTSTGCSSTSTPAACNMDIILSTPFVDYKNNAVWVTSHNGNSTGDITSPDVWKLDANTGAVSAAVSVGGDIDASPTGTQDQSVIFVGTNNGVLFAYSATATAPGFPVSPLQLGTITIAPADGAVKGFPLVANASSSWLVVVSTSNDVQAYTFDGTTFTLKSQNTTLGCNPSSPVTGPNLTDALNNPVVIVGCSDGQLHEINLNTGADEAQRIVDQSVGVVVGDPSLDLSTNEVIVGATDGRVFAFKVPF